MNDPIRRNVWGYPVKDAPTVPLPIELLGPEPETAPKERKPIDWQLVLIWTAAAISFIASLVLAAMSVRAN